MLRQCEAEKIQLPILRYKTLEMVFFKRGFLFQLLGCMILFVSPWVTGASHSLGGLSPEREGWIIILFRGEQSACSSTVVQCPCASQPRPLLRLSSRECLWAGLQPNACFVIHLAGSWVKNFNKRGFLNLTSPSYVGKWKWELHSCLGCFTPEGTGCHQVWKTHMYLQGKSPSEV